MNIRNLYQSERQRPLVLLLLALGALLVVALVVGSLSVFAFGDLTVSFSSGPSPDPVKAGTSYSFTAQVTVGGTIDPPAEAVVFEYRAPAGVVIESIQQSTPGDCEVGTPGDPSDPSTCSLGNMGTGGISSATIDVTVFVPPDIPDGTLLDNDIQAWQFGTEEEPPDNEAHHIVTVEAEADLVITKSARGDNVTDYNEPLRQFIKEQRDSEVTAGELLEYTLVITNTGPSDAQNVVVTDTLPPPAGPVATVHFVSADGADCRQDPVDRNQVTCELGTMAVTETRTIHILVRVDPTVVSPPDITNTATVSSTTTDPDTTSSGHQNMATNDTTVNAVADLFITKVDVPAEERLDQPFEPDQAIAGLEHRYLITFGNDGPSVTRSVGITDTLDFKQLGILGETFERCEPTDLDDLVDCSVVGDTVTVDSFLRRLEQIIPGDLNPGDVFSFWLITKVDPGYVLDADDLLARNDALIGTTTTDHRCENNQDTEDTEIIAEADLSVSKTDTPDLGLPDQYLTYDPVTNHFVFTYTITVNNLGPSDAATILLTDTLPVDTEFITWTIPSDMQCVFRDDGTVFCLMGEDPNNLTNPEPGRMNVGSEISFTIRARVEAGLAPRILVNRVEVGAVSPEYADVYFDFTIPDFQPDRRPTADPDLDNNVYVEETTVANPAVQVDKTVYVRTSPARGIDVTTDGLTEVERCETYAADDILTLPGDELTYCYLITNEGDTWLHSITLEDRSNPLIYRAPLGRFEVIYPGQPGQPALRGTITWIGGNTAENQTITIETTEPQKAVLAPKGVADDYDHILIIRSFTVDFPELGSIAGIVWDDVNENHVVDLNEPLSPAGVEVYLLNESDSQVVDDTITDDEGRYAFHGVLPPGVPPGRYIVWVVGEPLSPVIEFDLSSGYSIANFDRLKDKWYIESEEYSEPIFRMLGTNTARVDTIPSTKYSTPLPGIQPSGDCENPDPDLVCDTDLLHDTLALPVLEDTTKEWDLYDDLNGDGLPSPGDVIEYTVDILNTGIIEATGVEFYDELYDYVPDPWKPATLINGSVSAAIHVYGLDPITGREIDADVQPPDLWFGEDLLLRTYAPTVDDGYLELTYLSSIVLPEEIVLGNNPGDDDIRVDTRLPIPPVGYLLRFDGVTYDPPIPVTFSLRIKYQVRIKVSKYVPLGTIILNHGWLDYAEIGLFDQRFPNFDPTDPDPDAYTAGNQVATNHAGTPGRDWESVEFPGWPEIPEDFEPTDYPGDRFNDYAQPGAPIRDDDDPTWFKVERDPRRFQLPAIDNDGDWETVIQVQNASSDDTGAIAFFWGEYSGQCPYSDPGPVGYTCMWVAENGVWSVETQDIPSTARSAMVYSVHKDLFDEACADAAIVVAEPNPYLDPRPKSKKWRDWEDGWYDYIQERYHEAYEGTGKPIAVIVQREGPNDYDTPVSSAYPGISENMEGSGPPYRYFAPYAMRRYHDLDTEMIIQNSGQRCTQIWLDYQKQGDGIFSYSEKISRLAPGESIRIRVPDVLGTEWLGSIYIEADEPLGIVIDQTSFQLSGSDDRGALLTYEARSYKLRMDTIFYADLLFREWSGWEASIQVQNLTQESLPTWVTVEFLDASGDSIHFVGEWIPRAGGKTFYLPAITNLGWEYAGAAVIQSHQQVDYPGKHHPDGEPIFAVVDLKKTGKYDEALPGWRPTEPGEIQGGAYNAHAESEKKKIWEEDSDILLPKDSDILLPSLAKAGDYGGVTSLIGIRNNSNCNNIEFKLEVRKGSGTVVSYVHIFNLPAGHIKLIDLAYVGSLQPGFVGAGTVKVIGVDQLCDTDNDGHIDQEPIMPSVVVVNKGAGLGDVTSIYEGIPLKTHD